jgi:hypothetical protein
MTKFIFIVTGIVLAVGLIGGAAIYLSGDTMPPVQAPPQNDIVSFEECAAAGNAVMESYPRQCNTQDGKHFVEDIGNELDKTDLIRVDRPRPNQGITSPLHITGEARGYWFFEASFPVRLLDANGNNIPITPGYIMATQEWMTEDFVPFEATLEFTAPAGTKGTLVFMKDNPSGLPENDDQLRMPIVFAQSSPGQASKNCMPTGCSGQICADQEVITTCEFRQEYACYQTAVCARQASGECGWTQTAELEQCLANSEDPSFDSLPQQL